MLRLKPNNTVTVAAGSLSGLTSLYTANSNSQAIGIAPVSNMKTVGQSSDEGLCTCGV